MKNIVKYFLTGLFTLVYIMILLMVERNFVDFSSILGVTLASILALVISVTLAVQTTNKVIDVIRN